MLQIKNQRIIDFYNTHSEFDFESMNLLLIGLLEQISQTKNANREDILINSFQKLQSELNDMREKVSSSSQGIINLQTTIASIPKSMNDNLTTQLSIIKDNSIKDIERAFEKNKHSTSEHLDTKMRSVILDNFKNLLDSNIIELKNEICKSNSSRDFVVSKVNASCVIIGPWSRSTVTKCDVAPEILTPFSNACIYAIAPGNAGNRDGCMFIILFG